MPLVPVVVSFPVYEQGEYTVVIESIKLDEKQPYGSTDPAAKEACFKWTFRAVTLDAKTGLFTDRLQEGKQIKFYQTSGITYGGGRSTLTKTTNQILGRALDQVTEAPLFDYEMLVGKLVKLLISKDTNTQGEFFNKINGISPVVPVEVQLCLLPAPIVEPAAV
jgi:hypothetical protein